MPRYDTHWKSRSRKKRDLTVRWGKILVVPAVIAGCCVIAWVLFRSSLFGVERVEVSGAGHVDEAAVLDAANASRQGFWKRAVSRANLFGWPGELTPEAVSLVPGVKQVSVDRRFLTGSVILSVTERDPAGVWCFEATGTPVCQWFDDEGVVYGRAYVTEGSLLAVVHDRSQEKAGEGRRVLPPEQLRNFLAIHALLKSHGVSPKVISIAAAGKQELAIDTYNGPRMYFTLRVPPDQVAPVLDDFAKKGTLGTLQYLDFRSPKRAFYQ